MIESSKLYKLNQGDDEEEFGKLEKLEPQQPQVILNLSQLGIVRRTEDLIERHHTPLEQRQWNTIAVGTSRNLELVQEKTNIEYLTSLHPNKKFQTKVRRAKPRTANVS